MNVADHLNALLTSPSSKYYRQGLRDAAVELVVTSDCEELQRLLRLPYGASISKWEKAAKEAHSAIVSKIANELID